MKLSVFKTKKIGWMFPVDVVFESKIFKIV